MPRILSRFDAPPPFLATLKQLSHDGSDTERSSSASSSAIIAVIIIASAIILSSSFYLILRCVTRHCHRSLRTFSAADDVVFHSRSNNQDSPHDCCLIDSLPLFTFGSVTGNSADGGDCAVCLSKFEANDQLRLLPLCCHAFHAQCIDTWLSSNQTCPLCRSTIHPTDVDVLEKILSSEEQSNSFRIEIGSVSQRRSETDLSDGRRSYSIGSFDYIVEAGYEVSVGSTYRRESSVGKESIGITASVPASVPDENLAAEVSGRSWLRDYVDQLASISSRTLSFRSSSRTFVGSSRRSDTVVAPEDLEANHIGEDISELFRWFSGV